MFELYNKKYSKQIPGASCTFQPSDLGEYKDDPWDIRVSIGDAPLEEAFYITVNEPEAIRKSIRELLNEYVLNIERQHELDISDYPELPFLQQQLIEYFKSADSGKLKLDIFVNNNTRSGPTSTLEMAKNLLGTCVYDDHSYDYCVLDLILLPYTEEVSSVAKSSYLNKYAETFLLMLLNHYIDNQEEYSKLCTESNIGYFLGNFNCKSSFQIQNALQKLESSGLIAKVGQGEKLSTDENNYGLTITEAGYEKIHKISQEVDSLMDEYDCFDSVSLSPPALGVPDGFDARVQMMEYNGIDIEQAVFLCVLADCHGELFQLDKWEENLINATFMETVSEALSYKTSFSAEILEKLKSLAH